LELMRAIRDELNGFDAEKDFSGDAFASMAANDRIVPARATPGTTLVVNGSVCVQLFDSRREVMPGDPRECRMHAARCAALAATARTPQLRGMSLDLSKN
jgi:hypothetical protein